MTAFSRFAPLLQEKIVSNLGWSELRPVQDLASHAILDGKNCVVLAPTAGGKTEASMFPILSGCLENQEEGLRILYVCPTRALINNQEERLSRYAEMVGFKAFKWHGDVTPAQKKSFLADPCELVLTTPESLEVMLVSGNVPTARLFRNLKYVVVDEIHALASCDRGNHLLCVLERIRAYTKNDFQRIGLSATVGNPNKILAWLQGSSLNCTELIDPPKVPSTKQIKIQLALEPDEIQKQIIDSSKGLKSLLFCESRRLAEKISGGLKNSGEPVFVHHSSLSREEREEAELQFSRGTEACIVCTSTMELGIDVGDLDKVHQINAPSTVSSFLQRMGRTGRRAKTISNTTFFIEKEPFFLQSLAIVELARTHWVEDVRVSDQAWHILLHQIMALCLERGYVRKEQISSILGKAYCFSGIDHTKYAQFVDFLITKDFLHDDGSGSYSMGLAAEKVFGRQNFMEMYSVFSTPSEFEVVGLSGDVIGTVEWNFLEKLLEEHAAFFLAGKAWEVERIEWKKKCVFVSRAAAGKIPKWGGISPRFLGYEICRKMRDILISETELPYLDSSGKQFLAELQSDKRALLISEFAPIEEDEKGIMWWTYAGGFINNTLRFALKIEIGEDVQSSNEYIKLSSPIISQEQFKNVIHKMKSSGYWERPEFLKSLHELMPNYRLSKFQSYLPDILQNRLVADTILDLSGVCKFLENI